MATALEETTEQEFENSYPGRGHVGHRNGAFAEKDWLHEFYNL